jgi:hypothetical protein
MQLHILTKHNCRPCRTSRTFLNGLLGTCSVIIDLVASLSALVGPWEVGNRDDEERVAGVGDTGEGVVPVGTISLLGLCDTTAQSNVPSQECCKNTKGTSSLDEAGVWCTRAILQVTDAEHEEGHVKGEEEQEEGDGRPQCADQQDCGEDEPALRSMVSTSGY